MKLNEIRDNDGARHRSKRLGRGIGSGKGKTSGKGHKGQKARTGVAIKGFEGGQMPLYMRLPKRGFNNLSRKEFAIINLSDLQTLVDNGVFTAGATVSEKTLLEAGAVRKRKHGIKLLGTGTLNTKLTVEVTAASKSAIDAVKTAGGSVSIAPEKPEAPRKMLKKADRPATPKA